MSIADPLRHPLTKWRRRGSNEDDEVRNALADIALGDEGSEATAFCQCSDDAGGHGLTEIPPAVQRIAKAWPFLKPHLREAIVTLIDTALLAAEDK